MHGSERTQSLMRPNGMSKQTKMFYIYIHLLVFQLNVVSMLKQLCCWHVYYSEIDIRQWVTVKNTLHWLPVSD